MKNIYFISVMLAFGMAAAPFPAFADANISLSGIASILESLQAAALSLAEQVQRLASSPAANAIEIRNDGVVELYEWNYMKSKWFSSDKTADINGDGIVNSIDFGILNRGSNAATQ